MSVNGYFHIILSMIIVSRYNVCLLSLSLDSLCSLLINFLFFFSFLFFFLFLYLVSHILTPHNSNKRVPHLFCSIKNRVANYNKTHYNKTKYKKKGNKKLTPLLFQICKRCYTMHIIFASYAQKCLIFYTYVLIDQPPTILNEYK